MRGQSAWNPKSQSTRQNQYQHPRSRLRLRTHCTGGTAWPVKNVLLVFYSVTFGVLVCIRHRLGSFSIEAYGPVGP